MPSSSFRKRSPHRSRPRIRKNGAAPNPQRRITARGTHPQSRKQVDVARGSFIIPTTANRRDSKLQRQTSRRIHVSDYPMDGRRSVGGSLGRIFIWRRREINAPGYQPPPISRLSIKRVFPMKAATSITAGRATVVKGLKLSASRSST